MQSFLFGYLLVGSISLIAAVELDGTCTANSSCTTTNAFCSEGKCQCNAPGYFPCRSRCDVKLNHAYVGDSCNVDAQCVQNSNCINKICTCKPDLTSKNGLCFKALNATCTNATECWSQYCSNSRCACETGYSISDDGISCKRKIVKIYNTWSEANQNKEFCIDEASCKDIKALCISGPQNTTKKFCKCPYGYTVENNERCEAIVSSVLSPLDTAQSSYKECGSCADNNAVCMKAGNENTCWCRSGYVKNNNKCQKEQKKLNIIFPNSKDVDLHDFTKNCINGLDNSTLIENKLCTCAPGYELINRRAPCVKIQRTWINNVYEYGLCTRVTNQYTTIAVDGICPPPLKCEQRRDKHVCSCGNDKFQDLDDPTKCVHFIGKRANTSSDLCPTKNALRNATNGICECQAGYRAIDQNRRCVLTLSSNIYAPSCNSSLSNDTLCQTTFGARALSCGVGECRCSGNQSFAGQNQTRCYATVNETLSEPKESCPPNSKLETDRCVCDNGYRPSSNGRQCVLRTATLSNYVGSSTNNTGGLTTNDCKAIFSGPVEVYSNGRCQCKQESFINDHNDGCWYRFSFTLPSAAEAAFCPPNSMITAQRQECLCDGGFVANGTKCVQKTNRIYVDNDSAAPNITGLTRADCILLFGRASDKSTHGDYCICPSTVAYANDNNTRCYFLINVATSDIKGTSDCPSNTVIEPQSLPSACVCSPGYYVSADNRTCTVSSIRLIGAIEPSASTAANCSRFKDIDCKAKFGPDAFCQNETCFCDRRSSFVGKTNRCESTSSYVYPGIHEITWYSCNTDSDCSGTNVVCDEFNGDSNHKVCQCKSGLLLDPATQTCAQDRCPNKCNAAAFFECNGYDCVCKTGYYLSGSVCSPVPSKLELNQPCNATIAAQYAQVNENSSVTCNIACERVQCRHGYRPEKSECVKYELGKDKCVYQESICQTIDSNSVCNRDENSCSCRPSYYLVNDRCARAVGSECQTKDECGEGLECKGGRCACGDGQHIEDSTDSFGRPIQLCVNGINRLQFSSALLLLITLARMLFI